LPGLRTRVGGRLNGKEEAGFLQTLGGSAALGATAIVIPQFQSCADGFIVARMSRYPFVCRGSLKSRGITLAFSGWADSGESMIQAGFPGKEDRCEPIALARHSPAACRAPHERRQAEAASGAVLRNCRHRLQRPLRGIAPATPRAKLFGPAAKRLDRQRSGGQIAGEAFVRPTACARSAPVES
jgi:hypothetical protein